MASYALTIYRNLYMPEDPFSVAAAENTFSLKMHCIEAKKIFAFYIEYVPRKILKMKFMVDVQFAQYTHGMPSGTAAWNYTGTR